MIKLILKYKFNNNIIEIIKGSYYYMKKIKIYELY